jgi:hypothetical protein
MGRLPQTKYHLSDFPSKIAVIRRHHPLEGQALELLSVGKASVVVRQGDGSSMKIPRGWTDADGGPCTALTGHSQLCLGGLRELLNLVKALREPSGTEVVLNGEKIEPLPRSVGDVDVQAKLSGFVRGGGPGEALGGFPEAARAEVTAHYARLMAPQAVQRLRALRKQQEVGDEPNGHE